MMDNVSGSSFSSLQCRMDLLRRQTKCHRHLIRLAGRGFDYFSDAVRYCSEKQLITEQQTAAFWHLNKDANWAKHESSWEANTLKLPWSKLSMAESKAALELGMASGDGSDWPHGPKEDIRQRLAIWAIVQSSRCSMSRDTRVHACASSSSWKPFGHIFLGMQWRLHCSLPHSKPHSGKLRS